MRQIRRGKIVLVFIIQMVWLTFFKSSIDKWPRKTETLGGERHICIDLELGHGCNFLFIKFALNIIKHSGADAYCYVIKAGPLDTCVPISQNRPRECSNITHIHPGVHINCQWRDGHSFISYGKNRRFPFSPWIFIFFSLYDENFFSCFSLS